MLEFPCGNLSSPAIWKEKAKSSSLHYGTFGCSPSPCSKFEINLRLFATWLHGDNKIMCAVKMCNSTSGLLWLLRKEVAGLPHSMVVQLDAISDHATSLK